MAVLSIPARYYRQLIELDYIIEPTGRDDNLINVTVDYDDPLFPATRVALGGSRQFEAIGLERSHWRSAARIRTIFRGAFLEALDGYTIVDEPGDGVMLVNASLIDLRAAYYEDIPNLQREVRDIARPGTLVFLMELADSETGRVLGRAADSSLNPEIGSDAIEGAEWDAVNGAATHWANLFSPPFIKVKACGIPAA